MLGSAFAQTYGPKGFAAWEAAALDIARSGEALWWPMKPVTYDEQGVRVTFQAAQDYFAIGEMRDILRLPLSPITAQRVANIQGFLLPTPKMVLAIHRAAGIRLEPIAMSPNKYASMTQFVNHQELLGSALGGMGGGFIRSGLKKDVVIGNIYKPGKVLIYGWMLPVVPTDKDGRPSMTAPWRIQPYSNIHSDAYLDYSHGIRFIGPQITIDGVAMETEKALTDPRYASLLSDEGPLKYPRYPTPGDPKPSNLISLLTPTVPSYQTYGLNLVREGKVS